MFKQRTVVVVGAGASVDFDLPAGDKLKAQISELLMAAAKGTNSPLASSFRANLIRNLRGDQHEMDNLLKSGRALAGAIHSFISIDEALHYFSDDAAIVRIGKLAIAYLILRAERESSLKINRQTGKPDISKLSNTWLAEFLSMALSFAKRSEVHSAFENVAFVNFNYDRVIEFYLINALTHQAAITENAAIEVVENLRMIRPYGSLGSLYGGNRSCPYGGAGSDDDDLIGMSSHLLTYTEDADHNRVRNQIARAFEGAELTLFIGFGYHQQNMSMLNTPSGYRQVYGTALGIDKDNYQIFANEMTKVSGSAANLFDRTGYSLLHDLRPSIMAVVS